MNTPYRVYEAPEVWAKVPRWESKYEVSSHGRVRSLDRYDRNGQRRPGRVLQQVDDGAGYLSVCLKHDGEQKRYRVHTLVARAFWGRSLGQQVRHLDGNKQNCRASNLCWGSSKENADDKRRHGNQTAGDSHHSARLTAADFERINDLAREFSQQEIATYLGIGQSSVSRILRGAQRRKPHKEKNGHIGTSIFHSAPRIQYGAAC